MCRFYQRWIHLVLEHWYLCQRSPRIASCCPSTRQFGPTWPGGLLSEIHILLNHYHPRFVRWSEVSYKLRHYQWLHRLLPSPRGWHHESGRPKIMEPGPGHWCQECRPNQDQGSVQNQKRYVYRPDPPSALHRYWWNIVLLSAWLLVPGTEDHSFEDSTRSHHQIYKSRVNHPKHNRA